MPRLPTTPDAKWKVIPDEGGVVIEYGVFSRYEMDGHVYMLGMTSTEGFENASTAFVQLAAPTLLWIADWTACRSFSVPPVPDFFLLSSDAGDWVLLDTHAEPAHLTLAADGVTPVYRISGTYVYGHLRPGIDIFNSLVFPKPPFVQDGFTRVVPTDRVQQNIINDFSSTGNVTGGGGGGDGDSGEEGGGDNVIDTGEDDDLWPLV